MKNKLCILAMMASLLLAACSFPGSNTPSSSMVLTAAASTVSAQLTEAALLVPTATFTPEPTATQPATETPVVTQTIAATSASSGGSGGSGVNPACDAMAFISDVTVPDGTDFAPGATFTKTWRIRNSGTCSWTTSYAVVFSSGAAMNGPASQALTATIAPNSTLDVSVNLTAPSTAGSHTGYWMLRNAAGQTFGSFYVVIDVTGAGSAGGGETFIASQVGQVNASGTPGGAPHAGADAQGGIQAFALFDLSAIPAGSKIDQVRVDFSKYDTIANPFVMGCLRAIPGSYFPLDGSEYDASASGQDIEWCSSGALSTVSTSDSVKARVQAAVDSPSKILEYRLAFSGAPSGNALVRMLNNGFKLIITYTKP
ncbi:MAG: hypothetical protein KIT29_02505 [Anaerolineales bacterium]|nr:hypothetical protein [Anaerolineales bacterium]